MRLTFAALLAGCMLQLAAAPAFAQCTDWQAGPLDNGSAPEGANGQVYATIMCDPDGPGPLPVTLVVAGAFTSIGGVAAYHIAARDPATGAWVPLGSGVNCVVYALSYYNGTLVAAGQGDNDPGTTDNNILWFDGSTWQTFYGGTSTGSVTALTVYNGELYAGGNFVIYPTVLDPATDIAKWNPGAGRWQDVNSGTDGSVTSFAQSGGNLLVGGSFVHAGGGVVNHIAVWNGSAWAAMGSGAPQSISALAIFNGQIVAASSFPTASGYEITAGAWNGSAWVPFGAGYPNGMNNIFSCLAVYGGRLYAGGYFTTANGGTVNHVAMWDGSAWQPLLAGLGNTVETMLVDGSDLVVGGLFTTADNRAAHYLAQWNGNEWSAYGGGDASEVLAYTYFGSSLVAGGSFHQATGAGEPAHYVAGWNNASLFSFGTGMDNPVLALKSFKYPGIFGNTELIAGGSFTHAGGTAASYIARWDQSFIIFQSPAWAAMGPGFSGPVSAIERFNSTTYAGGSFLSSGATTVNRIARWNETTKLWEALGTGMNGPVYALCAFGPYLYAGGSFTTANGVATGGLARWDGASWLQVGGTFSGTVYALTVHNGYLVIGGSYPGINSSPNLAAYDGTYYYTYGTGGTNAPVRSLHSTGKRLFVGGDFTSLGGIAAAHVGYWDGSWHAMSGGTDNSVYALSDHDDLIHVGGTFGTVRAGALTSAAWADWAQTGVPGFQYGPTSQDIAFGSTFSLTAVPDTGYAGLTLRWLHNGVPLSDGPTGTGSTLSGTHSENLDVTNASGQDIGAYEMVLTNACGTDTSTVAQVTETVGVGDAGGAATAFEALGPNPTAGATHLRFSVARAARVDFRVLDVTGRVVRELDAGTAAPGPHALEWDGRASDGGRASSGLYFVRFEVDGKAAGTRRLVIVR